MVVECMSNFIKYVRKYLVLIFTFSNYTLVLVTRLLFSHLSVSVALSTLLTSHKLMIVGVVWYVYRISTAFWDKYSTLLETNVKN